MYDPNVTPRRPFLNTHGLIDELFDPFSSVQWRWRGESEEISGAFLKSLSYMHGSGNTGFLPPLFNVISKKLLQLFTTEHKSAVATIKKGLY